MKAPKKFKFKIDDFTFQLSGKYLNTGKKDFKGNPLPTEINMNHAAGASVLKQYVKQAFPNVEVASESDTFSGGNSVSIYISDKFGKQVDNDIVDTVRQFSYKFEYGRFNGMIDSYEYKTNIEKTDAGTVIDAGCKFIHVQNRPKFMSVPDVVKTLTELTKDPSDFTFGTQSWTNAVKIVEGYGATTSKVTKALKLLKSNGTIDDYNYPEYTYIKS